MIRESRVGPIAARVASGEITACSVVEAAVRRADNLDAEVSGFVRVHRQWALDRAAEIDRKRQRGEKLGRLAGVPVALKDNLALEGWPLTAGSRILEGCIAPYSATAVARLLAADAVPIGQTNMDEFGMGSSCENSAFGITRNPWDPSRVPGGSSGGSAAAVATGVVAVALGSDTGGSIRQPAAFCGLVGIKPTYGRVSRFGLVAFASSLDQIGTLAQTSADAAAVLSVIAGADGRDATSASAPVPDVLPHSAATAEGLRVGILDEVDLGALPAEVRAATEAALETWRARGATIQRVSVPALDAAVAVYYLVANAEASANLARYDGVRFGRRKAAAASLADVYVGSRSEGFGLEVKRRIMLGTFALSSGYVDAYYRRARAVAAALRVQFLAALKRVDLIALPTTPTVAFALGEKTRDPIAMYLSDVFTVPASLAGLPAVAVPVGPGPGLVASGLPLSVQLVGKPFDEATLLRAAAVLEREMPMGLSPLARAAEARGE